MRLTVNVYLLAAVASVLFCFCSGAKIRKRSDSEVNVDDRCEPGTTWFEGSTYCFCTDDGFQACPLPEMKAEEVKPTEHECEPGTTFKRDCNTCWCTENGKVACTLMWCLPQIENTAAAKRSKRSETEIDSNLDPNGRCLKAKNWKMDCNDCFCVENGFPACTLKGCNIGPPHTANNGDKNKNQRTKRSESEIDSNLDSNGRCIKAKHWMEDCNHCLCKENDVPLCTLMGCHHGPSPVAFQKDEIAAKAKRSTSGSPGESTKPNVEEKCVPGSEWMDDCNSCWCTDFGIAYCTKRGCDNLG